MLRKNRRIHALEVVVDGMIELLIKKQVITRGELQNQIIEDHDTEYVQKGDTIYKVKKGEEDERN